tara:strand:+ start:6313 stop:6534 length:222 start_codon:yes stop_codon:yes gene_type:complete
MRDLQRQINKVARQATGDYDFMEAFFADNEADAERQLAEIKDEHQGSNGLILYFQRNLYEPKQTTNVQHDGRE